MWWRKGAGPGVGCGRENYHRLEAGALSWELPATCDNEFRNDQSSKTLTSIEGLEVKRLVVLPDSIGFPASDCPQLVTHDAGVTSVHRAPCNLSWHSGSGPLSASDSWLGLMHFVNKEAYLMPDANTQRSFIGFHYTDILELYCLVIITVFEGPTGSLEHRL